VTKPTCIADYNNKYMGGVDCTDQLLKPYEIPCKTLKWYKKLAILYVAIYSQQLYCVSKGWWSKTIAALIFETGADMKIPREEHVIRLTECHFFRKQPLNKSLRRDARCVPTRKEFARTVAATVQTVQAIQDFVTIHVMSFTTPKSISGCETPH